MEAGTKASVGFESDTYKPSTLFRLMEMCLHRPVEAVGWRAKSALLPVAHI